MKEENIVFLTAILLIGIIGLSLVTMILLVKTEVKFEGNCSIDKLSFESNQTNHPQNLSLHDGKVQCSFKGEAPLIFILGR